MNRTPGISAAMSHSRDRPIVMEASHRRTVAARPSFRRVRCRGSPVPDQRSPLRRGSQRDRTALPVHRAGGLPGLGLWPLGWDPTDRQLEAWDAGGWPDRPEERFPHLSPWNVPAELLADAPPADAPWDVLDAYAERVDDANWRTGLNDGAIPIANLGCAIRVMLVVSGPERNHIWIDDRANDGGLYPAASGDHPNRMTFTDLLNDWLEQAHRTLETGQRADRLW